MVSELPLPCFDTTTLSFKVQQNWSHYLQIILVNNDIFLFTVISKLHAHIIYMVLTSVTQYSPNYVNLIF
jgi:hypothetical protein